MKDVWKSGIVLLLVIAALYIVFLRECKDTSTHPTPDEIIIPKSVYDSLVKIANLPPKIKVDTLYLPGEIVYVPSGKPPIPTVNPDSTKTYKDSLVNKEVNVWATMKVKGDLLALDWKYKPIIKEIKIEKEIYVPKIVNNPVPVPQRGIYISGNMGGNGNSFLFGGGIDYITKKNTEFGYIYQRFGNQNFHSVKMGIKLGK